MASGAIGRQFESAIAHRAFCVEKKEGEMSLRLKEITYKVRCTVPGCAFNTDVVIKENIMAATEADVDSEAFKIAKNQAYIKHDALYGRKHPLTNPDITKVNSRYERFGPVITDAVSAPAYARPSSSAVMKTYAKGEKILRRGESATTICELIKGSASNEKRPEKAYQTGATFGTAALFEQAERLADIVAGEDGTTIAFYDMRQLTKTDPVKARELYNAAMEDIFEVITYLEDYSTRLEKKIAAMKAVKPKAAKKPVKKAAGKKPVRKAVKKGGKAARGAKKAKKGKGKKK
jgi:CRP-like cAMP-binding protein